MQLFLGILCLVIAFIIFITFLLYEDASLTDDNTLGGFTLALSLVLGINLICEYNEITPMDVYKGNTTLKYTIIDGIKTDSVVIWKK